MDRRLVVVHPCRIKVVYVGAQVQFNDLRRRRRQGKMAPEIVAGDIGGDKAGKAQRQLGHNDHSSIANGVARGGICGSAVDFAVEN